DEKQGKFVESHVSNISHSQAERFLRFCLETGLKPKFVAYELGHIRHLLAYRKAGLIEDPMVVHLRVHDRNSYGPVPTPKGLLSYLDMVPDGVPFVWFCHPLDLIDPTLHHRLNATAIASGGHARTGLGDLPISLGKPESNPKMVERVATMA